MVRGLFDFESPVLDIFLVLKVKKLRNVNLWSWCGLNSPFWWIVIGLSVVLLLPSRVFFPKALASASTSITGHCDPSLPYSLNFDGPLEGNAIFNNTSELEKKKTCLQGHC